MGKGKLHTIAIDIQVVTSAIGKNQVFELHASCSASIQWHPSGLDELHINQTDDVISIARVVHTQLNVRNTQIGTVNQQVADHYFLGINEGGKRVDDKDHIKYDQYPYWISGKGRIGEDTPVVIHSKWTHEEYQHNEIETLIEMPSVKARDKLRELW